MRLARLTGDGALSDKAEKQVRAFAGEVADNPQVYTFLCRAGFFYLGPTREIVIAGKSGDSQAESMLKAVRRRFMPETVVAFIPDDGAGPDLEKLAPYLREKRAINGRATAYVCQNYTCQEPVTDYQQFIDMLN